jgi:hypothetical protein
MEGLLRAPSALEVLETENGQLEALVTSQGSDTIFVFAAGGLTGPLNVPEPAVPAPTAGNSPVAAPLSLPEAPLVLVVTLQALRQLELYQPNPGPGPRAPLSRAPALQPERPWDEMLAAVCEGARPQAAERQQPAVACVEVPDGNGVAQTIVPVESRVATCADQGRKPVAEGGEGKLAPEPAPLRSRAVLAGLVGSVAAALGAWSGAGNPAMRNHTADPRQAPGRRRWRREDRP